MSIHTHISPNESRHWLSRQLIKDNSSCLSMLKPNLSPAKLLCACACACCHRPNFFAGVRVRVRVRVHVRARARARVCVRVCVCVSVGLCSSLFVQGKSVAVQTPLHVGVRACCVFVRACMRVCV